MLGGGPDAADEAVNVMVDFLFKYVHHLADDGAAPFYLRLMAARRARKLRDKRRRWGSEEPNPEAVADALAVSADEAALSAALMPRLDTCLEKLSAKARQALALRYRGDLTSEAIGGLLGGSKQYIGRLITQSLQALRECLSGSFAAGGGS